jgi:microsomal dipeptidase-like Zn-dependent dipeptidase
MNRAALVLAALLALCFACNGTMDHGPPPCQAITPRTVDPTLPPDTVYGFVDLHAHPAIERAFGGRLIWGTALDDAPVDATELPLIESCPIETHDRNASAPVDRAVGTLVYPRVAQISHFAHAAVGAASTTAAWPNSRDVIHQQMNVASIRRAYEGGLRLMFASTTDNQVIAKLLEGPDFVNGFVPDPAADFESAKSQIALIQQIVEQNTNWMDIARSPSEARQIINSGRLAVVVSIEMDGVREGDFDTLVQDYGANHIIPVHLIDNDVGGTAANSDLFNAASAEVSEIYRSDGKPMKYLDMQPSTDFPTALTWPQEIVSGPTAPLYVNIEPISYPWYNSLCYEPLVACAGTTPSPTSFIEFGHQNLRGLCSTAADCQMTPHPGIARVGRMMDKKVLVDVSHMSDNAVNDALTAKPTLGAGPPDGYPLIASHGDLTRLCEGTPTEPPCVEPYGYGALATERSLRGESARKIVERGGVLGLGTGTGTYTTRTVLEARGGPILSLDAGAPSGCLTTQLGGASAAGCIPIPTPLIDNPSASPEPLASGTIRATSGVRPSPVPFVKITDPSANAQQLQIDTVGGVSGTGPNSVPFVKVELRGSDPEQYQHHVILKPLECSTGACTATVDLGAPDKPSTPVSACTTPTCDSENSCGSGMYSVDQIQAITLEMLNLGCDDACQQKAGTTGSDMQCQNSGGDNPALWTIEEANVTATGNGQSPMPIVHIGPEPGFPVTRIGGARGTFTLFQRSDRPGANVETPATGHLLRVTLTSGPEQQLQGAGASTRGTNVCVAVRQSVNGVCVSTAPIASGAQECPTGDGWVSINQRGTWGTDAVLYTFVRFPGQESAVCGVDVAVLDWDASNPFWTLDEVKVESVEDPVGHFIQRYAEISKQVANGQMGAVGFGTDFNGLNGTLDISEFGVPEGTPEASSCLVTDSGSTTSGAPSPPQVLAPMRLRNADGSLGPEVRIQDRGLATYGMLADMVGIIDAYPGCGKDVHDSLMLSAEATIRAWEMIVGAPARPPLPTRPFACGAAPWSGP